MGRRQGERNKGTSNARIHQGRQIQVASHQWTTRRSAQRTSHHSLPQQVQEQGCISSTPQIPTGPPVCLERTSVLQNGRTPAASHGAGVQSGSQLLPADRSLHLLAPLSAGNHLASEQHENLENPHNPQKFQPYVQTTSQ